MAVEKKEKKKDESVQENAIFNEEQSHEEVLTTVEIDDNTSDEPMMSITAVEEMLKNQEERWTQRFNKLVSSVKLNKAKGEMQEEEDYISDLTDDWLENPAVFFAYSINYSIHGDKNRGIESTPPQGPIRFKPIIRQKRAGRRGEEVISVSSVRVHSKAVAEYMRNHSKFGIAFFEDMDSVLNMNTGWAQKLVEANSSIQSLSDQQVLARCKQEGIVISSDIIKMRKALVEKLAERSIKQHNDLMYGKLRNAVIDQKTGFEIIEK